MFQGMDAEWHSSQPPIARRFSTRRFRFAVATVRRWLRFESLMSRWSRLGESLFFLFLGGEFHSRSREEREVRGSRFFEGMQRVSRDGTIVGRVRICGPVPIK
jgi:hypothetical protein